MIKTGFETRVKVQQVIENQLPEFLRSESPKAVDFLKQYYISQEYQGGPVDIAENLDQYLRLDNLSPEVISGSTTLSGDITDSSDTISVNSTKGFPAQYGLFQVDNEIITYTGITTNSFTGCIRGFSGITTYRSDSNPEELVFSTSSKVSHTSGSSVKNLSAEFLKEFYKKLKYTFTPGLEDVDFVSDLDVSNFIKEARTLYQAKGTKESFRILFNVLYGVTPQVVDLEDYLIKPSSAQFLRREIVVAERVSGDPNKLIGQTIKKSSDTTTQGSVSEVEIFTRAGISTYYKIGLFVGYDDKDLIEGTFNIQPKAYAVNAVSAGSSVITVDSTIGFPSSGTIVSGTDSITYGSKTVNQFLDCSGIDNDIAIKDEVRTDEVFFGYEDGDITKKVEIRVTGVLSEFSQIGDIKLSSEGQKLYVKNVGEKILNPESNKTRKQIFANSWIYNTSSRFEVEDVSGSTFELKGNIDRSTLKVGDTVDILEGSTETVAHTGATVATISGRQITLDNLTGFTENTSVNYTIRRTLETVTSSGTPIIYGNNVLTSDTQNVYSSGDEYFYVASNSLPSYDITKNVVKATLASATGTALKGYDINTEKYSILSFSSSVPFLTGDEVYYTASDDTLIGVPEGTYYVKVLSPDNQIKLYLSRSLIVTDSPVEFTSASADGSHTFVLATQKDEKIRPQKVLKKFPTEKNIKTGNNTPTIPGSTGMLINGVEVINYKSLDKVYYGPVDYVTLYNKGKDYDVVSPPSVTVSSPGTGTTSLIRPVVTGTIEDVIVDPQDFDIKRVISATVTGGNGSGTVLQPVVEERFREVEFDARLTGDGGGIDMVNETITFLEDHNLREGDAIVYNRNGNSPVGVGSFGGNNNYLGDDLSSGSVYYAEIVNTSTIKLYPTEADYNSGINTIGFTTSVTQGIHNFRTFEGKNTLRSIKILEAGSPYQNRRLIVEPENISSIDNIITFEDHGFNDGDIVTYSTDGTTIGGLSASNRYYILKQDDDRFKLANAGVGGTITTNYERREYVNLTSSGTGYQNFAYPDIQINLDVEYDGVTGTITATPIIRGEISHLYLYEKGTGYGSDVINFHKRPKITIQNGKDAEIQPIVSGGKIVAVQVTNGGSEYTSAPLLTVNGVGVGARLRAVVNADGEITSVVIINAGVGYDSNTTVTATPNGRNAFAEASVRHLTLNNVDRFDNEILVENPDNSQGIEYGIVGYSTDIGSNLLDDGTEHSPIIGWAYDGNPIYGPYAYTDPYDSDSTIKTLDSGYTLSTSNVVDRPSGFSNGFFVEDYTYDNSGDLDQYNGRYGKTPDFPNGVYAYFATLDSSLDAEFPYFVGDTYRNIPLVQDVNQDFDFNNSNLTRNTLPYNVAEPFSDNDFISEPNEILTQTATIESTARGRVTQLIINQAGSGYAVGDVVNFDNTGTDGCCLTADIKTVTGKTISDVTSTTVSFPATKLIWEDDNKLSLHVSPINTLVDGDSVFISGLTTDIQGISGLSKSHKIGIKSDTTSVMKEISTNATAGVVTDIYVSRIPSIVSVGSSIGIGTEIFSVLNVFPQNKVLRVSRGVTGTAHTVSTEASVFDGKLTLNFSTQYFNSKLDDKVYFNPTQSVGIGTTTGISVSKSYSIGDLTSTISVPTQSIYLPNHPFKTSQEVSFTRESGSNTLSVSDTETSSPFNLHSGSDTQTVYVISKSKDYIGLATEVGLTTSTDGLYFRSFTANGDSDDYKYAFESNFTQVTGEVKKVSTTVSVGSSHLMNNGDSITLTVEPNQSVGVGTSTGIVVKYNSTFEKLLVNPVGFNSTGVSTTANTITLTSHNFETGDKVFYNSTDTLISGLTTGAYFVYRVDSDNIKLSNTKFSAESLPPTVVSFASTGGASQELSKINPKIEVIRNNNLVFDVSDTSLNGFNFKIFKDKDFYNELVSTGSTTTFSVTGFGTVGVTTNATVTLDYSEGLSTRLYYALEKGGYISTSDTEVSSNAEIAFVDSAYNGSYKISGITSNTFNISLSSIPEVSNYTSSNTETLKYSSSSPTARGGVDSLKVISSGNNYKKLPKFVNITSAAGVNADIIPQSTEIGRINEVTIIDQGFDFSADKTLNPEVYISPIVNVINKNTISGISIVSGGSNYTTAPDLVIVNPDNGTAYDTGFLEAELQGSSIASVSIQETPKGLSETVNKVYAINNSNGVAISTIRSSSSGIVTCTLVTPLTGFSTDVFSVGEEIFVEGIQKYGTDGEGFNSEDHEYNFFTVTSYTNTNPAIVAFDISDFTSNAGIAVTNQNSFASIISKSNYPVFTVTQTKNNFIVGETLYTKNGSTYTERDLVITEDSEDFIKVYGTYTLEEGDVILGKDSGTLATVNTTTENRAIFRVDYSLRKDIGWADDVGKLNEDYQVTPDNDYYQNLSYTIKSPIEWEDLVTPVNRLLHTSGLKNFADTGITSTASVSGASTASTTPQSASSLALLDIIESKRVDTINNFDRVIDLEVESNKSKFLKFENIKLSDYIKCLTNRVLEIDQINDEFLSGRSGSDLFVDVDEYNVADGYSRFLVQISNPSSDDPDRQTIELVTLPSPDGNILTLEKGTVVSENEDLGEIRGFIGPDDGLSLRFTPTDSFDSDYDIKVIKNNFSSTLAGVGTQSIGFINLTGSNVSVSSGTTESIISANVSSTEAFFANVEVRNTANNERNYVEIYVDHDGTDTYISEYFFDNADTYQTSGNFIGSFAANIDSGVLSIDFTNDESDTVFIRSKIVGFGTTASGIGTYRFAATGQPADSVRSARIQSNFVVASGVSTVFTVSSSDVTSIKSIAKVSYGSTSALHQMLITHDGTDSYLVQYPFLAVENTTGIGTFGSVLSGSNLELQFFPESGITDVITVQTQSEIIQTELDFVNTPLDLVYGPMSESVLISQYDAINGDRINKTAFDLEYSGTPIFQKTFNPSDTDVLELGTGTFTIDDHFFNTGEKLFYASGTSFEGQTSSDMQDSGGTGIGTTVFAIRVNNNQFRIASSLANANAGTAITFSSAGDGNAHTLEMEKKMEKSIISIDGIVQSPITYTSVAYTLQNNISGSVSAGATFFAMTGIATIFPGDLLRIEDEYLKVESVGLGTTSVGPITGTGSFNVVKAQRGFVGSSATSHTDSTEARVYIGSFNIVGSKIHFTEPPTGSGSSEPVDAGNLEFPRSTFGGRVYLRQDYSTNQIYDNISREFTGIGATYTLTVGGANTTGIETGSGVLFLNNIFQTPTTSNNSGNNYSFSENSGISSVVFTGITDNSGDIINSEYDVNINQLPRGGVIVSLGSTPGLGYAPLVGASVTAVVGAGGSIVSVGLGTTDIVGSGYNGIVSIGISVFEENHVGDVASITATVGAGGTLSFSVGAGGTGYSNPAILVSEPSYENLEVVGVSRLGIGATTDTGTGLLLSVEVGETSTTGIGSTLFEVKTFNITRPGYGFKVGDVFTPVGLVTDRNLSGVTTQFELTVLDTFTDGFSAWQFGELDYIDSIATLQDGTRQRFPLYYNNQLLSFEIDEDDADSAQIDLNAVLLIFVNGVIQKPGEAYTFEGGTSFRFTEPPRPEDNVSVFFYRGTRGTDSLTQDITETVKVGDTLTVRKNPANEDTVGQDPRVVHKISESDRVETNIYTGLGIDEDNYKPVDWTKQKSDLIINNEVISKARDSIEAQVYPTSKIIGDFSTTDTQLFVDNAQFFNYEENESSIVIADVDGIIVQGTDPVAAAITAVVSAAGTISSLTINDGGSGYTGSSVSVSIAAPKAIGVGVGTTATATVSVTNGALDTATITNPGFGYTQTNPPQVLAPTTNTSYENITGIDDVEGFSGIITGITTTTGTGGHPLALQFFLHSPDFNADLLEGYPILIKNTSIGSGVTSVDSGNSAVVGIGTTFLDNVYIIHTLNHPGAANADIIVNIDSGTDTTGLSTVGVGTTNPVGRFSWGRLSGFTRDDSPISIGVTGLTVNLGLTTFPSIQRRGYGLRDSGSLRKKF